MSTNDQHSDQPVPPKKRRGFLDILLSDEPEPVIPVQKAMDAKSVPPKSEPKGVASQPVAPTVVHPSSTPATKPVPVGDASVLPPTKSANGTPVNISVRTQSPTPAQPVAQPKQPTDSPNLRKVTLTVRSAKAEEQKVVDAFQATEAKPKVAQEAVSGTKDSTEPSSTAVTPPVPHKPDPAPRPVHPLDLPQFPLEKQEEDAIIGLADLILGIEQATQHSDEHPDTSSQSTEPAPTPEAPKDTTPSAEHAPVCEETPLAPFVHPIAHTPVMLEGIDWTTLQVAYLSMEIGIDATIPTYAGGLGILAGDMLRSCADLELPVVGVTLLHREGYFTQHLDESGWQHEERAIWKPEDHLVELPRKIKVTIEGRMVSVRAWMYRLAGVTGFVNPILFLDTDLPENVEQDRAITNALYAGDQHWRLIQEVILGVGGFRMLEALGASRLEKFHMNEGHSTLLTVELYKYFAGSEHPIDQVRERTVFTTHTPVAAGHDTFPADLARQVLGDFVPKDIADLVYADGVLNMTRLGLQFSRYVNGVAKKHVEVTRELFPGYHIDSITNGVHAASWTSPAFTKLFDQYLPGWQADPYSLRYALSIPGEELWRAHEEAKRSLIGHVNARYHAELSEDVFTIGFARRATAYKRGNMLFSDIDRLRHIAAKSGKGIQIIYGGKAHPRDEDGKHLIQEIVGRMGGLVPQVRAVYLEDYDIALARLVVSGVDLWLNTPMRPQEASGTSGMKAALNGVPHFSVLDGWWLEGHIENATGWSIGPHPEHVNDQNVDHEDIEDMYMKLEYIIIPRYYEERDAWIKMMRQAIAINGSFFNSHRMVEQYVLNAYFK